MILFHFCGDTQKTAKVIAIGRLLKRDIYCWQSRWSRGWSVEDRETFRRVGLANKGRIGKVWLVCWWIRQFM